MTVLDCPRLSIVDLEGADAIAILNNLTTNNVRSIGPAGVETFLTNVKGKCVGHVVLFAIDDGFRMIGAGGQSHAIADLVDRYTIREDARAVIRDADWHGVLVDQDETTLDRSITYPVPWLGQEAWVQLRPASTQSGTVPEPPTDEFHRRRVAAGFPWFGVDFDDANLPQEASRDGQCLSFTKGCYLGQETVARLDALGQVQKRLVRWTLGGLPATDETSLPAVDDKLFTEGSDPADSNSKPVGRLTSVVVGPTPGTATAIGFARRSHFDAGSRAVGFLGPVRFQAVVAESAG